MDALREKFEAWLQDGPHKHSVARRENGDYDNWVAANAWPVAQHFYELGKADGRAERVIEDKQDLESMLSLPD